MGAATCSPVHCSVRTIGVMAFVGGLCTFLKRKHLAQVQRNAPCAAQCRRRPMVWMKAGDELSAKGTRVFLRDLPLYSFEEVLRSPISYAGVGAYAIFDETRTLQYVGYSRNVSAKLKFHASVQKEACRYFKVLFLDDPDMVTPDELENVLDVWILQNGKIPRGNTVDSDKWEIRNPTTRPPVPDRQTPRKNSIVKTVSKQSESEQQERSYPRAKPYTRGYDNSAQYDPFDPFSASRESSRSSIGSQMLDNLVFNDTWYPVVIISSVAFFLWLVNLSMQSSVPMS
eukprot:Plantae.Rhodophyta-Purpureofilum_apyrenoidigerum.ctg14859.p1 GENE.Plantae.Rhodophyta-Purpureofilum_apyrenoidigerum.ctg14859~~Plantae.Rhodophyta-Purpureofilum_apyrenoidigerum.ctg14859.p1  ORF type:complete len:293 (+),score=31.26 Plantae.Rhodophyta-Purpureofilum_apyrenoidigerum.ctg14859:25-879(+)